MPISFRYALNLAEHGELTYNLGERVEGYTNFLWTILMSAVLYLGGDVAIWSRLLGVCFGGTLFAVCHYLHRNEHGFEKYAHRWWTTGCRTSFRVLVNGWSRDHDVHILSDHGLAYTLSNRMTKRSCGPHLLCHRSSGQTRRYSRIWTQHDLVGRALALEQSQKRRVFQRITTVGCAGFLIYGPYFGWRLVLRMAISEHILREDRCRRHVVARSELCMGLGPNARTHRLAIVLGAAI